MAEDQALSVDLTELQRRAVRGSVWTVVYTLVSLPLSFAANALIARALGVSDYGRLAFLTAVFTIAVPVCNFGINSAVIQHGSRAEAHGRKNEVNDLLGRSLAFQLIVELPLLVIVGAALTHGEAAWKIVAVGAGLAATCVFSGGALAITIESRSAAGAELALGVTAVSLGATVGVAVVTHSAAAVFATRVASSGAGFGVILFLLDRRRRRAVLRPRVPRRLGSQFWRYSLFSWASGLVGLFLFSRSEIFLLKAYHQTEAVGLFALAFGLSQQLTAPADALLPPLLPAVASVLSKWPERATEAFDRGTRVSSVVCGAIVGIVVPPLVMAIPIIFGSAFTKAAWLLVPLAVVSAFQSVNNPVTAFLSGRMRADLVLRTRIAGLTINIGSAVALIPLFGVWGAAIANAAGQLTALLWMAVMEPLVRSRLGTAARRLYSPFAVGVIAGAGGLLVGAAVDQWNAIGAIAASCSVGVFAFLVGLRLFRNGLTVGDRDALVSVVFRPARPHLTRLLRPVTTGLS